MRAHDLHDWLRWGLLSLRYVWPRGHSVAVPAALSMRLRTLIIAGLVRTTRRAIECLF